MSVAMKLPATMMNKSLLALAALTLCTACSTPWFESTPNWLHEGGRLCAANRDVLGGPDRAAPRSCVRAAADIPSPTARESVSPKATGEGA